MKRNLLLILCGLFLSGFFGPSDPKGQFDKAMEYYSDGKTDKYEKWLIKAKEQNYAPAFFQHYLSQTGQEPRLTEGSPNTEFIGKCSTNKLDKEEIEAFNFILWEYEYTERLNASNNTPGFAFCTGINNLKQAVNLQFQPAIAEVPRVERAIKKHNLKRIQQREQTQKEVAEYKAQREKEREEANRKAKEEARKIAEAKERGYDLKFACPSIVEQYTANQMRATNNWTNKKIVISGKVVQIGSNYVKLSGSKWITLNNVMVETQAGNCLMMDLTNNGMSYAENLNVGNNAKFVCKGKIDNDWFDVGKVWFYNCSEFKN